MIDFNKQLKGGLKKCPLHKFGANYNLIKDFWYQCEKCKAFHKINLLVEPPQKIKIKPDKWGINYEDI